MNRYLILVALLAIFWPRAGRKPTADATLTPEPTPKPRTEAPDETDDPAATEDGGDGDGEHGIPRRRHPRRPERRRGNPDPGDGHLLQAALQEQGLDAGEAEFALVNYGDRCECDRLTAFRIPGVTEVAMEQLARVMSGVGAEGVDVETLDVGGKTVLSFSSGAQDGVVYFYVVDDTAFTIAGQNTGLVEQLISELP